MKRLIFLLALLSSQALAEPLTAIVSWDYAKADMATWNVWGFNVERKAEACALSATTFSQIALVEGYVLTYTDTAVIAGNTYCYRVSAIGPGGNSPFSNTAEKTFPGVAVAPPATFPAPLNLVAK